MPTERAKAALLDPTPRIQIQTKQHGLKTR